jgi:hypothetical protein
LKNNTVKKTKNVGKKSKKRIGDIDSFNKQCEDIYEIDEEQHSFIDQDSNSMNFQFIENDENIDDSLKVLNEFTVGNKNINNNNNNNNNLLINKANSNLYQLKEFSIVVQKLNLDKYKMPVKLDELIKDGKIDKSEKVIPEKKSRKRRASKSVSVITISEDESDDKDVCMNDTVFAKWNDRHYYPAIVLKIINNSFHVKYLIDDSLNIVSRNDLILIKELQKNDDVLKLNEKNEYEPALLNVINKDYFEIININNNNEFER